MFPLLSELLYNTIPVSSHLTRLCHYVQAEIAMRADGKPGMSDEEVWSNGNIIS